MAGQATLDESSVLLTVAHLAHHDIRADEPGTAPGCNVDPPRDPGVPSVGDMPKNPVEGTDAAGPADHPQVQPDRHHLRGMRTLAMQPVEGVDRISGEIGGAAARLRLRGILLLSSRPAGRAFGNIIGEPTTDHAARHYKFESISLQQTVSLSRDFSFQYR